MYALLEHVLSFVLFPLGTWRVRVWHSCLLLLAIWLLAYLTR